MSILVQPSGMRQQPQQVAPIDWSNPITQGLVAVISGSLQYDPVSGKPLVNSVAANRSVGAAGRGVDGRLGQVKANLLSGLTVAVGAMFVVAMSTDANTEQVVAEIGPASAFADGTRGIRINAGKIGAYTRNLFEVASPGTYVAGSAVAIGTNYNGSFQTLNLDGVTVNSGTTAASTVAAAILNVGGITTQASQYFLRGPVVVGFTWSRNLSDAEYASLAKNPWQLFKAPSRNLYLQAAAVLAAGAIAWTEQNDAQSISAVATDRVAAAWTEQDDVLAAAARVTNRASVGWTESNDSTTLAGTVLPNASGGAAAAVAWTEASDVMTLAGALRDRGAVVWTEQDDAVALGVHANTPAIVTATVRFHPLPRDLRARITHFSN